MSVDTLKSLWNKIKMNDFYSEHANYIEQKEKMIPLTATSFPLLLFV